MRKIILITLLVFVSCKQESGNKISNKSANTLTTNEIKLDSLYEGDYLISDGKFVNSINDACKINGVFFGRSKEQLEKDNKNCSLSKIVYDYEKLEEIGKNKIIIQKSNDFQLFLNKVESKNDNESNSVFEIKLFVVRNNSITDSIIYYRSINYGEALVTENRYFYLKSENLYLLDIVNEEVGSHVESYSKYKINKNTGKINLEKELIKKQNINSVQISNNDSKNWIGQYLFETTDRDNLSNSYLITVKNLDDINVKFTLDDSNKTYDAKCKINDNKIEISFNNNEDIIYIEKTDNNYYVSGIPIAEINPGNDSFPIKKIK